MGAEPMQGVGFPPACLHSADKSIYLVPAVAASLVRSRTVSSGGQRGLKISTLFRESPGPQQQLGTAETVSPVTIATPGSLPLWCETAFDGLPRS